MALIIQQTFSPSTWMQQSSTKLLSAWVFGQRQADPRLHLPLQQARNSEEEDAVFGGAPKGAGYGASQSQSEASYLKGELKNITTLVMPIYATSHIADSLVWRQRCLTPSAQFWLQFWLCNGTRRVVCNTTHDPSTTSDSNDKFQLDETVTCRYASPKCSTSKFSRFLIYFVNSAVTVTC